jgi:hypothetical protein
MNLMTIDCNDEQLLGESTCNWILGLIRCRLSAWHEPDREHHTRAMKVILDLAGKSKWYAEIRAWQVVEEMRLARMEKPALALLPAAPEVEAVAPIQMLSEAV